MIIATARCEPDQVLVEIEHRIGRRLAIAFARARNHATDVVIDIPVEDGERAVLVLPTRTDVATAAEGALVVTNAGLLRLDCGQTEEVDIGPRPVLAESRRTEWPAIAAVTLARLESLRAFDALYALLHPDVRRLVSPGQVACWFAGQLVGVTRTDVVLHGVTLGPWTWSVNGKTYEAAEITYRQVWVLSDRSVRMFDGVEHLVLHKGQWRWFLGLDAGWLAALPEACPEVSRTALS